MFICVTNRHLCQGDFLSRIAAIAREQPYTIILREKDLAQDAYEELARGCQPVCRQANAAFAINANLLAARKLAVKNIHLSMALLIDNQGCLDDFERIGASIHSVEEAVFAEKLGATYLIAGHIFATACKQDLAPRGLGFLREVCQAVSIPVFGIGGINGSNIQSVIAAGAAGGCLMSSLMVSDNIPETLAEF